MFLLNLWYFLFLIACKWITCQHVYLNRHGICCCFMQKLICFSGNLHSLWWKYQENEYFKLISAHQSRCEMFRNTHMVVIFEMQKQWIALKIACKECSRRFVVQSEWKIQARVRSIFISSALNEYEFTLSHASIWSTFLLHATRVN